MRRRGRPTRTRRQRIRSWRADYPSCRSSSSAGALPAPPRHFTQPHHTSSFASPSLHSTCEAATHLHPTPPHPTSTPPLSATAGAARFRSCRPSACSSLSNLKTRALHPPRSSPATSWPAGRLRHWRLAPASSAWSASARSCWCPADTLTSASSAPRSWSSAQPARPQCSRACGRTPAERL